MLSSRVVFSPLKGITMQPPAAAEPSRPGPPRHMADLLSFIATTPLCRPREAREMASAIRSLGAWLGKPLCTLPTDPATLRRHLASLHPEVLGVSAARFANVRSLLNRALGLADVKPANRPIAEVVSPAWRALFTALSDHPYLRSSLAPFARFCAVAGIEPASVSDAVARDYLDHLVQTSLTKNPQTVHQTVCRTWNQARSGVPGWPDVTLTVPRYVQTYSLPLDAFPAAFRAELEAYLARLGAAAPTDLLNETAPTRPLRPGSIRTKRYQIRQFASALVRQGVPIERIHDLAVLVELQNFKRGLGFFLERNRRDKTSTRTAGQIAHTIRSIAKYWVELPDDERAKLDAITVRLNKPVIGMTEKNRERLAQFDDEVVLGQFLLLSAQETAKLLRKKQMSRQECVTFSLLVALEILLHAPMRVENLGRLRTDKHIRLPRHAEGEAVILLPRSEVKNREDLQYLLPPDVTALVRQYLVRVKPMLETETSPFLFPGRGGCAKRSDTLSKQLSRLVWDRLGIRFSPHLMRHLAAKLHVDVRPGDYETPRRLLGHRSHDTTFRSYQGLETRSANRLHDELIRSKRNQFVRPRPPAGRRARRGPDGLVGGRI
jgi:integrase